MNGRQRLTVALLLSAACFLACREPTAPGRHVVLILLDTARSDHFSVYDPDRGTSPRLEELAGAGVVFENHFSQSTHTRGALPQLLYSRYFTPPLFPLSANVPFSDPVDLFRRLDSEAISLPRALAAYGYRTAMISAHTWLKPQTSFAREFQESYDLPAALSLEPGFPHPRADAVVDFAVDWLERHRGEDVFLYLHLMDNHAPRVFDDNAARFFDGDPAPWLGTFDRDLASTEPLTGVERQVLDAIYDGTVYAVDRELGRLFDLYRSWGNFEETLIALTSDHGEFLQERTGFLGHGGPWFDLVARIPWLLSYPARLSTDRVTGPTELVDVAPTLLSLLELELPREKSFDGDDALVPTTDATFAVGSQAILTEDLRVLFDTPNDVLLGATAPEPVAVSGSAFDRSVDPLEAIDVWNERQEEVNTALARYRERLAEPYTRYASSRTERQPASAFAVAARHFNTDRPVPRALDRSGPAARGGWVRSDHWRDSYLLALPRAQPLSFEFDLPDGVYEVSAAIAGACALAVGGSPEQTFEEADSGPVDVGEVEVRSRRLTATIAPATTGSTCSISYLGFRPEGVGEGDPERDERLRALGYIN